MIPVGSGFVSSITTKLRRKALVNVTNQVIFLCTAFITHWILNKGDSTVLYFKTNYKLNRKIVQKCATFPNFIPLSLKYLEFTRKREMLTNPDFISWNMERNGGLRRQLHSEVFLRGTRWKTKNALLTTSHHLYINCQKSLLKEHVKIPFLRHSSSKKGLYSFKMLNLV